MADTDVKNVSASDFLDKVGSLAAGLFVLYLMVSFNFIPEIFSCHLQVLLKNSFWMKHLIGLFTVFFFINVTTASVPWDLGIKFAFSLVLYILFMFSNKSEFASQIGFILIIFVMYIIQLVRDQIKKNAENAEPEEKESLLKNVKVLGMVQAGLFCTALVIIVIGHIIYIGKKRLEFRGTFNYFKMFQGSTDCKGTDRRFYTVKEAITASFQNAQELQREETARLIKAASYFENVDNANLDLQVESGLRWRQPRPEEIVSAGRKINLSLSPEGLKIANPNNVPMTAFESETPLLEPNSYRFGNTNF